MAVPLDRTWYNTLIDDDGSGTTGTVWDKAAVDSLMDAVDGSLAGLVDKVGGPGARHVARFTDNDTLFGGSDLLFDAATGVTVAAAANGRGLTIAQAASAEASQAAIRVQGYSPAVELIDKDGLASWHIGLDDNDNDAFVIGAGYGPGQNIPPALRIDKATFGLSLYSGVTFPTTAIPSSDPYTLDDFREWTWNPVIGGSGGASGQTYGAQGGMWQKVGGWVTANFYVSLTNKGTMSGTVQIEGLPVASHAFSLMYSSTSLVWESLTGPAVNVQAFIPPNSTTAVVLYAPAAGVGCATPMPVSLIGNTTYLVGSFRYPAAA